MVMGVLVPAVVMTSVIVSTGFMTPSVTMITVIVPAVVIPVLTAIMVRLTLMLLMFHRNLFFAIKAARRMR